MAFLLQIILTSFLTAPQVHLDLNSFELDLYFFLTHRILFIYFALEPILRSISLPLFYSVKFTLHVFYGNLISMFVNIQCHGLSIVLLSFNSLKPCSPKQATFVCSIARLFLQSAVQNTDHKPCLTI